MHRRTYLLSSAGVLAGLAGCSKLPGISGGSDDGSIPPADTAETFQRAVIDGDLETANELRAADARFEEITDHHTIGLQRPDYHVVESEPDSEEREGTVVVRVDLEAPRADETTSLHYLLGETDDGWKLRADLTNDRSVPPVEWSHRWSRREDVAVSLSYVSGMAVVSSNITIFVDDTLVHPTSMDETVLPSQDDLEFSLQVDDQASDRTTEIAVLWSAPAIEQTEVFTTISLPFEATVPSGTQFRIE